MNTFLLHNIQRKLKYNKVTQWFHTLIEGEEHMGTPAETIMEMNDLFIDLLKTKHLNLGISEKLFRRSMCSALCTMKLFKDVNIYRTRPNSVYPAEWNRDVETMWQEWLDVRCFKNWTAFWARLPVRTWETDLPGWRKGMESILLSYVQREIGVLVDANVIVEDEYGDYVDSNQYEYDTDRWE
jgi:hypothetical protein